MKLYHGSKNKFAKIERRQATVADGVTVPKEELQDKIYFTPDIGFAIAMASGPIGMTSLVDGKISFENQEQFEEDRPVYIYEIESDKLPSNLLEQVDGDQFALDMEEVVPDSVHEYKAKNVFDYYESTAWQSPNAKMNR